MKCDVVHRYSTPRSCRHRLSADLDDGTAGLPLPSGERVGVRGEMSREPVTPSPHPSPTRTRVYPSSDTLKWPKSEKSDFGWGEGAGRSRGTIVPCFDSVKVT